MAEQPAQDALDLARAFLAGNHRAVLVTRRRDGGIQTSPVTAGVDAGGRVIVSTVESSAKARNLARDPRVTLCAVTERWFGPWVQIEGNAELVHGAAAVEPLVDYYRRISGEHPDWEDYRRVMVEQQRLLIRITPEHAVAANR